MATKMEKLKELAELKSAGALTEEEFNAEKAKVLAAVDDAPVQGQAVVAPQGVQLMAHQPAVMQATPQQPAVMPSINIVNTNTNTNTNVNNNKYGYRPCIPCCIGCQVCCFSCFLDSCCCCPCSCCGNAAPAMPSTPRARFRRTTHHGTHIPYTPSLIGKPMQSNGGDCTVDH